jgi:hypothetical protein
MGGFVFVLKNVVSLYRDEEGLGSARRLLAVSRGGDCLYQMKSLPDGDVQIFSHLAKSSIGFDYSERCSRSGFPLVFESSAFTAQLARVPRSLHSNCQQQSTFPGPSLGLTVIVANCRR